MVEVKDAYMHGKYKQILSNSLHIMSNVKVFATQDGRLAMWTNMTDYIGDSKITTEIILLNNGCQNQCLSCSYFLKIYSTQYSTHQEILSTV